MMQPRGPLNHIPPAAGLELTRLRHRRDMANAKSLMIAGAVGIIFGSALWYLFGWVGGLLVIVSLLTAIRGLALRIRSLRDLARAEHHVSQSGLGFPNLPEESG